MGSKGREILKTNPDEVVALLKKALADEWLAAYQYWVGAQVAKGPMRPALVTEMMEHMKDELKHADILAKRILQLGGTPWLDFESLLKESGCGYLAPKETGTGKILKQNIKGEQCAIAFYNDLLEKVRGKDPVTHNTVLEILKDEIEHEEDLETLLEDRHCDEDSCDCGCH